MSGQQKTPIPLQTRQNAPRARKRLFIGLALATAFLLCLLLGLGWVVPFVGFGNIHPNLPWIMGALFFGSIAVIIFATLCFVVHVRTGRSFLWSSRFRGWATRFFLPVMELIGRMCGVSPEEVRHSFIKVNNELVLTGGKTYRPEDILVLLPHCIQKAACSIRLSYDVDRCQRCGGCPIGGLLDLRDRYGIKLAVATGGSIARRIVVEARPRFILAVACERDLSSGIQDTYPLPVYGLLNERPNGPCYDTQVDLERTDQILCRFLGKG